jgi:hypothetical protein
MDLNWLVAQGQKYPFVNGLDSSRLKKGPSQAVESFIRESKPHDRPDHPEARIEEKRGRISMER